MLTLVAVVASAPALAQQTQPPAAPVQPAPSSSWNRLPRMELQRQFAGPLQDTIVQRWRDPADGTVCYIYLPISAEHSPPAQSGFVNYGPNTIGSLSCFQPEQQIREPQVAPAPRRPGATAPNATRRSLPAPPAAAPAPEPK